MTKKREEIDSKGTTMDMLMLMAEGNPGAITVMMKMLKEENGLMMVLHMDDMNIRGTQIWVGYNDHCGKDIKKFVELVKRRDVAMIDTINREGMRGNHKEKAIHSGASYGKREMLKKEASQ